MVYGDWQAVDLPLEREVFPHLRKRFFGIGVSVDRIVIARWLGISEPHAQTVTGGVGDLERIPPYATSSSFKFADLTFSFYYY